MDWICSCRWADPKIYTSGTQRFGDGSSIINGKVGAKAWCNFNASGDGTDNLPEIRSWFNIGGIERLAPGKLKITFNSGVFDNNHYVYIGTSHGTATTASKEDITVNTVGLVLREVLARTMNVQNNHILIKQRLVDTLTQRFAIL